MLGFLYIDGHVRVYHGHHRIPKAHVPQMRLAVPATTDYYVNDKRGEPLFVVTAEANAGMVKMLLVLAPEIRSLVGEKRRPTIVFDRGGWSPRLFAQLLALGFDVLTYRKGRVDEIAPRLFKEHTAQIDGRAISYRLHDKRVSLLDGSLRLRQVTRLTEGNHQTSILTSRFDLRAIEVAYRMFERWRQENFFKYMRDEFAIDALSEHATEPDDPTRTVPNPTRRALTYVAFGLGGAGAITGGVFGAMFLKKRSDLRSECVDGYCRSSSAKKISTYHTYGTVSVAAGAVGVAGLGAGLVLLLTEPKLEEPPPTAGLRVRPLVGLGLVGAEGTFQ